MSKMNLKQRLQQFRQWQRNPFNYTRSNESHVCNNCGDTFEGNYCPVCGQKWSMGRITWKNTGQGILELWGLHTRSLPYSLLQLILRPGYFIADYISGRRQVSFPPVKMLVIMGLFVLIANNLLVGDFTSDDLSQVIDKNSANPAYQYLFASFDWLIKHDDWTLMFIFSFLIWPTWALFRYSPRCPRHTLPEGFFIQVFNSVQVLMLLLVQILLTPLFPGVRSETGGIVLFLIVIFCIYRTYRQLFGYGIWGTLWRLAMAMVVIVMEFCITLIVMSLIVNFFNPAGNNDIFQDLIVSIIIMPTLLVIFAIYQINIHINKRKIKKASKATEKQETETTTTNEAQTENS